MSATRVPPASWARMNVGTDAGALPAKVPESIRPVLIAGAGGAALLAAPPASRGG
ncbi:MAG TPA: hypothetical protein VMU55_07750 [Solirubrobacteraceae bacterium]|nr:hypothetical protein [Solirubrobacteraceae bacterium]